MKKLEIIVKPERLEDLKSLLDECKTNGIMISNIMGHGSQGGYKQACHGAEHAINLLPKIKVETVVSDETAEKIIDKTAKELRTGNYGDGKIFVYEVQEAIRIRTGERGEDAL